MYKVRVLSPLGMYYEGEPQYFATREAADGYRDWVWCTKKQACTKPEVIDYTNPIFDQVNVLHFCVEDQAGKKVIFESVQQAKDFYKLPYSLFSKQNKRYRCSFTEKEVTVNEKLFAR